MTQNLLADIAAQLVAGGRGILAMDESNATCNKRFAHYGVAQTVEKRRQWRELLITTPDLASCISGVILYDETMHQADDRGVRFIELLTKAGIRIGIKVDTGAKPMALHRGETLTQGLDGLRERLVAYATLGATFAKWRAVISLGSGLPTRACIEANAEVLAQYALCCQECCIVPIIEPEISMAGDHTLDQCRAVTSEVLHTVFAQLYRQGVMLNGIVLKPNMVVPGLACPHQETVEVIAEETLNVLQNVVPAAVPGIAFLSGGQSGELATARLNQMNRLSRTKRYPWSLAFSFARALQTPALEIWRGETWNSKSAQQALFLRANCNRVALTGEYSPAMEVRHL